MSKNINIKTSEFIVENSDQIIQKAYEYNDDKILKDTTFVPNPHDFITVRGAKEHNLKDVSLVLPKNKLVVFSGLSGSGKSSLVFDTIYAEGQRRYVESLSSYARQFLGLKEKPSVDSIDGLSPAISIDQKSTSQNPRSTVGTITEVYDYLRLLYSKVGTQHCHECGSEILGESFSQMYKRVIKLNAKGPVIFLAPMISDQKGWHKQIISDAIKHGIRRVRVNGQVLLTEEAQKLELNKQQKHTIEYVVDRFALTEENSLRITETIENTIKLSGSKINVLYIDKETEEEQILFLNKNRACPNGHPILPEVEPRQFSFNSPHGACPYCSGLGTITEVDPDLVVPNNSLTIREGCIKPVSRMSVSGGWLTKTFESLAPKHGFNLDTPWRDLSEKAKKVLLYGDNKSWEGVITNLNRRYKDSTSDAARRDIESYMNKRSCPHCGGSRLRPETLSVTIGGKNIAYAGNLPINEAYEYFLFLQNPTTTPLNDKQQQVARMILKEVVSRLKFLVDVGLSYLTLMRSADTLSGGEAQRIRLATQIGSGLTGVLYILDEPSIGLHQKDNTKLLTTLKHLRNLGNTVLVVEHDEDTMEEADFIFDIGPKAGKHGGHVVAYGTPEQIKANDNSPTGRFLSGKEIIAVPTKRRTFPDDLQKYIEITGARENNLKNIDVKIPLRKFVTVTGVSGSGKSTLVNDILSNYLMNYFYDSRLYVGKHDQIKGLENIDKPIIIDQSPIGRTPRSNPATYTGLFTPVRELFSTLPESIARGYMQGRFSFNVPGGRCETCEGDGVIKVEMNFLPDVYVTCDDCKGKRYNRETLEIKYKEKNIAEILEMTVDDAVQFFDNHRLIKRKLDTLKEVGLGYIHLGQSATTLSGGEAQRIKLATELSKVGTGNTLYILDEPTTGLHPLDVKLLLEVLHKLVDKGNTVLVIEHNLDVIKTSDHVIDIGLDGGNKGGEVLCVGTPEEIIKNEQSYTGKYLKKLL
jgi:excinuclease ABC subunit A